MSRTVGGYPYFAEYRLMKSKISCCRLVRSTGSLLARLARLWGVSRTCVRHCSAPPGRTQPAGSNGPRICGRDRGERPDQPARSTPRSAPSGPRRAILAASSACGGIGRRARLRALWTLWSVEVRVLSGALGKAPFAGLFCFSVGLYSTVVATRATSCERAVELDDALDRDEHKRDEEDEEQEQDH